MTKPLSIERVEEAIDSLAKIIVQRGDDGLVFLPIYERLEREVAEMRQKENATAKLMDSIRSRVKRSSDRTATRS